MPTDQQQTHTPIPEYVSKSWYLAGASAEGHVYETKIIRGADLLKTYAGYMYQDGLEDMPDEDAQATAQILADPNCWSLVGKHWAYFSTEFEDGTIEFTLITDEAMAQHATSLATIEALRGALAPFAALADSAGFDDTTPDEACVIAGRSAIDSFLGTKKTIVSVGDIRRANALLSTQPAKEERR